jgi:hypothetical protein
MLTAVSSEFGIVAQYAVDGRAQNISLQLA